MRTIKHIGIELELAPYVDGVPVVAGRYMTADKDQPLNLDGHLIHRDASMVELAMPPASSADLLAQLYHDAMSHVSQLLPEVVVLRADPAVEYTDAELALDPYASVMGCSSSSHIYGQSTTPSEYTDNVRYGGMHVNIEADKVTDLDALLLDTYLGLHSVVHWEQDHKEMIVQRRKCYGMAGEYRIKDFGIEYRTLPSSAFTPDRTALVWCLVERALNANPDMSINVSTDIQRAIQTCDAELAAQLIQEIWE